MFGFSVKDGLSVITITIKSNDSISAFASIISTLSNSSNDQLKFAVKLCVLHYAFIN